MTGKESDPVRDGGNGPRESLPWIETREGGFFFLNAVLVAPEIVVLIPLLLRTVVDFMVPERAATPFLDTIPFVASKSVPVLGWLLVVPIWATLRNLRVERHVLPRIALGVFLALHLSFLGYAVWHWIR